MVTLLPIVCVQPDVTGFVKELGVLMVNELELKVKMSGVEKL
jgi:hypothetical protein